MGSTIYTVPRDDVSETFALIGHQFAGLRFEVVAKPADRQDVCELIVTWPNDQAIPTATGTSPLHTKLRESDQLRVGVQAWLDQTIAAKDALEADAAREHSHLASQLAEARQVERELRSQLNEARALLDSDDGTQQ
jgi:hypothetical protein